MASTASVSHAVTANRLIDGVVVFHAGDGWSTEFARAAIVDGATRDALLAAAATDERDRLVVGAYAIDIDHTTAKPRLLRERIRAFGPTIEYLPAHLKQAAQ